VGGDERGNMGDGGRTNCEMGDIVLLKLAINS